MSAPETDLVIYETPAPGVARIVLNRAKTANAGVDVFGLQARFTF